MRTIKYLSLIIFALLFSCSKNDLMDSDVVFIGDSRVYYYPLSENYPQLLIKKNGIRGAKIEQIINAALNESGSSKLYVFAGINDIISFNSNHEERVVREFINNLGELDSEIQERLFVISILPYSKSYNDMISFKSINDSLKQKLDVIGINFVDVAYSISDSEGFLKNIYTSDGLHLNRDGYRQVTTALLPWILH